MKRKILVVIPRCSCWPVLKVLLRACVPRLCYAAVDGTCIHVSHSTGSSSRALPARLLEKVSQLHRSVLTVSDPGLPLERRSLCPTPLSSPSAGSSISSTPSNLYRTSLDTILLYGLKAIILRHWAGYDFGSAHVWVWASSICYVHFVSCIRRANVA